MTPGIRPMPSPCWRKKGHLHPQCPQKSTAGGWAPGTDTWLITMIMINKSPIPGVIPLPKFLERRKQLLKLNPDLRKYLIGKSSEWSFLEKQIWAPVKRVTYFLGHLI